MMMTRASGETLAQAAALACELWPGHAPGELLAEWETLLSLIHISEPTRPST